MSAPPHTNVREVPGLGFMVEAHLRSGKNDLIFFQGRAEAEQEAEVLQGMLDAFAMLRTINLSV